MQIKKKNKVFIITVIATFLFTVLRCVLLYTDFDFDSGFFSVKPLATFYYITLIVFCALIYFTKKIYVQDRMSIYATKNVTVFFHVILALLFIGLTYISSKGKEITTPLETVAQNICVVSSGLSVIYYAVSAFVDSAFTKILNLFPVLFFVSTTILSFIEQTGSANTYNEVSHILSIVALAFIVLEDGKYSIDKNCSSILPVYFIALVVLCQSAIPDIITLITKSTAPDINLCLLSVIKIVYAAFMTAKLITKIKTSREDNK